MPETRIHNDIRFDKIILLVSKHLDIKISFFYTFGVTIFIFFTRYRDKVMHMADALLSPTVGGIMWGATAAVTVYSARKLKNGLDDRKIPLMGVLGAFVFAAQMINFSIPGTGSSGHLGGGLLLAVLLGPHAAFLTLTSVLTVQALFFADGGLLALGCNIFNLGFFPCFVAYPLIYKVIVRHRPGAGQITAGSILAAVVGLQLGSAAVVLQTYSSALIELPLFSFLLMMQPIHLAIGLVEGFATAGVVSFIRKARPEILDLARAEKPLGRLQIRNITISILILTLLTGGILAWYASEDPDGLEWSLEKVIGTAEPQAPPGKFYSKLDNFQQKTSLLPDYAFRDHRRLPDANPRPGGHTGTSAAGLLGGFLVLSGAVIIGFLLKKKKQTA